jgi:hypothetical protein
MGWMSEHGSLTGNDTWYGTQMKPEMFEPFTAEWGGRLVHDTDWLFQRQMRLIYSDGYNREYAFQQTGFAWNFMEIRYFWLPEVFGTFTWAAYLRNPESSQDAATLFAVAATLWTYALGGYDVIATTVGATWTPSEGDATYFTLKLLPDPDWHALEVFPGANNRYACLRVLGIIGADFGAGHPHWITLQNLSLRGDPRT